MEYLCRFALRRSCFGSLFFLPFGLKATETKIIKVTFDARNYQSCEEREGFIKELCRTPTGHPEYEAVKKADKEKVFKDEIRFCLTVKNGNIPGTNPRTLREFRKRRQSPKSGTNTQRGLDFVCYKSAILNLCPSTAFS